MNWRHHPDAQAASLNEVLRNVGVVQTVIFNQATGRLVDGHLRVRLARERGERTVKTTIVDLSEDEERIILATLDPLSAMAGTNEGVLRDLIASIEAGGTWLDDLLAASSAAAGLDLSEVEPPAGFAEYDENIATEHECPKCGYKWSGGSTVRAANGQDGEEK